MLAQPASDPPVLGRERDEAGEERSLRSWAVFRGLFLPEGSSRQLASGRLRVLLLLRLECGLRGGVALAGVLLSRSVSTTELARSLLVRVAKSGRTERSAASKIESRGRRSSGRRPRTPLRRLAFGSAEARGGSDFEPTLQARIGWAALGQLGGFGARSGVRSRGWAGVTGLRAGASCSVPRQYGRTLVSLWSFGSGTEAGSEVRWKTP
jgi:hypothetical protein